MAVYLCLVKAVGKHDFDAKALEKLDCRAELDDLTLTEDDEEVEPSTTGDFGAGGYDTGSDVFVYPDPDSTTLGDVTEF